MPLRLISQEAEDLIIAEEVSSKAVYEKRYRDPEWPGGRSGVTIGIGYDVGAGVKDKAQLWGDWRGQISDGMIRALEPCVGVTGDRARALLSTVKSKVDVPWSAAIAVFENVDIPRWSATVRRHLPNCELLALDSFGALVSLAYNRGPSFSNDGDRYTEMRNIKAHMAAKRFERIPAEFRAMKRLWPNQSERGLVARREHEAKLFERGLKMPAAPPVAKPVPAAAPPAAASVAQKTTTSGIAGSTAVAAVAVAKKSEAEGGGFDLWLLLPILIVGASAALVTWFVWPRQEEKAAS